MWPCVSYEEDETGEVTCLHCTYDPATRGGDSPDGRKVKGTIHWAGPDFVNAEVRLYGQLYDIDNPGALSDEELCAAVNPDSLTVLPDALVEPAVAAAAPGEAFQFVRNGYFCADPDTAPEHPVFNRTVQLNSSYKPK